MMARLTLFLMGLSTRERLLLAALAGVALPVAILFFWILPIVEARSGAVSEQQNALFLRQWVDARSLENTQIVESGVQTPARNLVPIGISGVEQGLEAAGLRQVAQLAGRDDGAVELRFEAVEFNLLTRWLDLTEPTWGYRIQSFRFERIERAGLVDAEIVLGLAR